MEKQEAEKLNEGNAGGELIVNPNFKFKIGKGPPKLSSSRGPAAGGNDDQGDDEVGQKKGEGGEDGPSAGKENEGIGEEGKVEDGSRGKVAKKEKSTKPVIEAENTLEMIQKTLGSGFGGGAKKKAAVPKKKKATEPVDKLQKFFNHYSENPHLQQIENGYLKYLQVQHAKESHLKAIKKFQILYALRRIQRYWKAKYQEIRERSVVHIQRYVRKFIDKMNWYREQLHHIN